MDHERIMKNKLNRTLEHVQKLNDELLVFANIICELGHSNRVNALSVTAKLDIQGVTTKMENILHQLISFNYGTALPHALFNEDIGERISEREQAKTIKNKIRKGSNGYTYYNGKVIRSNDRYPYSDEKSSTVIKVNVPTIVITYENPAFKNALLFYAIAQQWKSDNITIEPIDIPFDDVEGKGTGIKDKGSGETKHCEIDQYLEFLRVIEDFERENGIEVEGTKK